MKELEVINLKFKTHCLIISMMFTFGCSAVEIVQQSARDESIAHAQTASQNKSSPVEFIYNNEELKKMDKWKEMTLDDMMTDAYAGDPAALHMVGLSYLYGGCGFPINVSYANQYFAAAVSLGFAPSIDKITHMYIEDLPNPFLAMVYANLVISFGHTEFIMGYHTQRSKIVEIAGPAICDEIERIAAEKKIKIFQIIDRIEQSENKNAGFDLVHKNIVDEDMNYDPNHWMKFIEK